MLKDRFLLRLVLLGALVLGASALMSATAGARPSPVYTLCGKVAATELSTYTSPENCLLDNPKDGKGGWVHLHPILGTTVLLCIPKVGGGFSGGLCTEVQSGGAYGISSSTLAVAPMLEGKNRGISTLKGKVLTEEANISCVTNKFSILPEASGKASKGEINYSGCTVIKPAKCEVKEPIEAKFNGQLEEPATGSYADKFTGSETEKEFVRIEFKNKGTEKCSVGGESFPVTGSQTCTFGPNVEMMSLTQEVICAESGSNLKLGGKTATYTGIDIVELPSEELGNVELGGEHPENSTKQ